jgi:hypothetical protein
LLKNLDRKTINLKMLLSMWAGLFALFQIGQSCKTNTVWYFPNGTAKALALMQGISVNGTPISGMVMFQQDTIDSPVVITVSITGLAPSPDITLHGLHVHEYGFTAQSANVTEC